MSMYYKSYSWNDIWNLESGNIAALLREIVQLKYIRDYIKFPLLEWQKFSTLCVFNYLKFYKLSEIIPKKLQNALRTRQNN